MEFKTKKKFEYCITNFTKGDVEMISANTEKELKRQLSDIHYRNQWESTDDYEVIEI